MNPGQANEYVRRINLVTDYIDCNLGSELTLSELASVAGFSEYHFHRIFAAMTGETLFCFITRLRIEHAAALLCTQPSLPITRIAADCGFSSHAVFCRLFKKRFGTSPSAFRSRNQGQADSNLYQLLRNRGEAVDPAARYNGDINSTGRDKMNPDVRIEKIEKTRLAYIRYVGPYANDASLFENPVWAAVRLDQAARRGHNRDLCAVSRRPSDHGGKQAAHQRMRTHRARRTGIRRDM